MGDLINDLRLAMVIFILVYVASWASGMTGSKRVGIILGIVIVYLTVYQHFAVLVLTVVFFFGYAFFGRVEEAFTTELPSRPS